MLWQALQEVGADKTYVIWKDRKCTKLAMLSGILGKFGPNNQLAEDIARSAGLQVVPKSTVWVTEAPLPITIGELDPTRKRFRIYFSDEKAMYLYASTHDLPDGAGYSEYAKRSPWSCAVICTTEDLAEKLYRECFVANKEHVE